MKYGQIIEYNRNIFLQKSCRNRAEGGGGGGGRRKIKVPNCLYTHCCCLILFLFYDSEVNLFLNGNTQQEGVEIKILGKS